MKNKRRTKQEGCKCKMAHIKLMHKNSAKGNEGITLIALVVTIVVLLILAGVVLILALENNGIINKTVDAKEKTTIAQEKENVRLAYNGAVVETKGGEITDTNINDQLQKMGLDTSVIGGNGIKTVTVNQEGRSYTIASDGTVCGPSYGITGLNNELEIISGSFQTIYVVSGRTATLSIRTNALAKRLIVYDGTGKEVKFSREQYKTDSDKSLAMCKYNVYGSKGDAKYYALVIDENGKRSINMLEDLTITIR